MNTILWAINSQCHFHCKYCYLDFDEENNPVHRKDVQEFQDLSNQELQVFLNQLNQYDIQRIFIAGAEPLATPEKTFEIIKQIKQHPIQVILCTNGYFIEKYQQQIIESQIDAISISLDSYSKQYNNQYRGYPTEDGFERVIQGIKTLKQKSKIKVGVYTVLTKLNYQDLEKIYQFVSDLKIDYFVFQPIFLHKTSTLFQQLVLQKEDAQELSKEIEILYQKKTITKLPNKKYTQLMLKAIQKKQHCISNCFAGKSLFFITPDGEIHACPSSKRIPQETMRIKVNESHLEDIFIKKKLRARQCDLFSEDCVNMWQLMSFDEIC